MSYERKLYDGNKGLKILIITFLCIYVFTSGFVYFEPSICEIYFCISLLYLIFITKFDIRICTFIIFIMLFNAIGILAGLKYNMTNIKYISIDYYLFIVFFMFYNLILTIPLEKCIDKIMRWWTAAGIINIFASFTALATGVESLGMLNFVSYGMRFQGFFKDPNVLGPFLIIPFLYWFEEYIKYRKKDRKVILTILSLLFGIVFSFSRAAWLNAFVGTFYLIWIISKGNRKKVFFRILAVILGAMIIGMVLIKSNVNFSGINFKTFILARLGLQSYDEKRFDNQRMVFALLEKNPVFGVGPGNYEKITEYAAHSLYIRTLGEHGIIGIIFLVMLIIIAFIGLYRKRYEYAFLPSGFLGLLINSFFIDTWHWRHFWILLSIGFFIYMNSKKHIKNIKVTLET